MNSATNNEIALRYSFTIPWVESHDIQNKGGEISWNWLGISWYLQPISSLMIAPPDCGDNAHTIEKRKNAARYRVKGPENEVMMPCSRY